MRWAKNRVSPLIIDRWIFFKILRSLRGGGPVDVFTEAVGGKKRKRKGTKRKLYLKQGKTLNSRLEYLKLLNLRVEKKIIITLSQKLCEKVCFRGHI